MDEFNNNPFNEDKSGADPQNPYQQPVQDQQGQGYDPYNQQPVQGQPMQNGQPYQQPYNVPPQNGQYQQGQNPYGMPQGYGVPYQTQQSTGMAVASLVLGIISICTGLFMFSFPFLFLVPIIGIILGIVFKTKKLPVGKGMSTAGIITSVIGLVIPIALLVFVIVMLVNRSVSSGTRPLPSPAAAAGSPSWRTWTARSRASRLSSTRTTPPSFWPSRWTPTC